MVKTKFKLLYLLIPFLIFNPLLADESWYQTAANLHKEWAKTYHAEGMTDFTDYMAMANTEEKLEEILLKDK